MGCELIKSSLVSSHQSSCITICWQLPPSPNSAYKFTPNCYQICIGSVAPFPPYQFLVYFWFPSPLAKVLETSFTQCFVHIPWFYFPPLAFPLTTVPCRVPPPLDRLSPNCQYGHFPTCALNERPTNRCSMVGPLILSSSRETPLSTYKVTSVWSRAYQGSLSTLFASTNPRNIWPCFCIFNLTYF